MLDRPASPKHTSATRRTAIYPYYAGFSEQFVESILKTVNASHRDSVLDPWNGSGTTTAVCCRNGIRSVGVDINPAMEPIAAVRSMPPSRLQAICEHALKSIKETADPKEPISPFTCCGALLAAAKHHASPSFHAGLRFGFMVTCRTLARRARSKNPTWYSLKSLQSLTLDPKAILNEAASTFTALRDWKDGTLHLDQSVSPKLVVGDWTTLRMRPRASHVITSPPYLTRIDYVMKTLPELLLLSDEKELDIRKLRQAMLGGVLTGSIPKDPLPIRSGIAARVLAEIRDHSSKASSSYYFQFFSQYFLRLEMSIKKIVRTSCPPCTVTFVTQGSYYKEIFIDLPAIIDEIFFIEGYSRVSAFGFLGSNTMVSINRRSVASGFDSPPETAAVYERR